MKILTFFICCLFVRPILYAQDSSINLKKFETFNMPDFNLKKLPFNYTEKLKINKIPEIKTFLYPGITILPLDNMPCFVPDIAFVSNMPNKYYDGSAIRIPNKIVVLDTK